MEKHTISKGSKIIILVTGMLCISILLFAIINSANGNMENQPEISKYEDFAKCITDAGAILYTSNGCPHCLAQKNLLGKAIEFIEEVECTSNPNMCIDAGIIGVPTWIIGEDKIEGFDKDNTMKELSDITQCPLP
jgi:glutaredoxin